MGSKVKFDPSSQVILMANVLFVWYTCEEQFFLPFFNSNRQYVDRNSCFA